MFFVTKKEYNTIKGALHACSKTLDAACREYERVKRENTALEKKKKEEAHRAEHFQSRCETYENAAHNAGFEFVRTPSGYALKRLADDQPVSTFWERLKAWPNG